MEQDFTFPIIVIKEGKNNRVRFIDFDIKEQIYDEGIDYITESKKNLTEILLEYERQKITIPIPQSVDDIRTNENEYIIFINVWLPFYRSANEKYVKKTLTIPDWIDQLSKKQNLNFSQILKDALLVKLGLSEDIKKLKAFKFSKPMRKIEDFLVITQKLLPLSKEKERELFVLAVNTKDLNLLVTIFVIWLNKNISVFLAENKRENIEKDQLELRKQEWIDRTKLFKEEITNNVKFVCADIEIALKKQKYYDQKTITSLIAYSNKLAYFIISSALKYNGAFEREESIYDCMRAITDPGMLKQLIKKEYRDEYTNYYLFTLQHEIEIPYLYILAWNIKYLYQEERFNYSGKYNDKNRINICHECLKHVSATMLEILLGNPIFCERLEPEIVGSKIKNKKRVPIVTKVGNVDFSGYLPYLHCSEDTEDDYVDIKNKIVSENILGRIPMVPMSIRGGDRIGLKYIIHSLCSDLEKY